MLLYSLSSITPFLMVLNHCAYLFLQYIVNRIETNIVSISLSTWGKLNKGNRILDLALSIEFFTEPSGTCF